MHIRIFDLTKCRAGFSLLRVATLLVAVALPLLHAGASYIASPLYVAAMKAANERMTVIIDAGHGGEDSGAIGVNGIYEKDLNLIVANELGRALADEGFAVVFTRTEDKLLYSEDENIKGIRKLSDLKNRCKIAAEYKDSAFVSIHMNSYTNSKYSGLQVYYSENNALSYQLAASVQGAVRTQLQPDNARKIKPGKKLYLLENTYNPSVLVECGFLTNPEECAKLSEKEYQKSLSFSIACGIIEYIEKTSVQ